MVKLKTIPIKDRMSFLFLEKGNIDVLDGSFIIVDKKGIRTQIPVGNISCIFLEPGCRITHAAISLAARVKCLIIWVGEGGVRLYSSDKLYGTRSDRILHQAKMFLDKKNRLKVVRKMYALRFNEEPAKNRSVEQLRGIEGARVRKLYKLLANLYKVDWKFRNYDKNNWGSGDLANRCLSSATACLYGICEAAILASGFNPAIGFIHTGKSQSFVYDIADIFKFETVVPLAFKISSKNTNYPERDVRLACRDLFREKRILKNIVPVIKEVLFYEKVKNDCNCT